MPGTRPELLDKALAGPADAVVLDLEDAVAAEHKAEARRTVARLLERPADKPLFVRVNHPRSPWGRADVEAVAGPHLGGLRIPKCESVGHVELVVRWLGPCQAPVHCLLESALGVERAYEIASAPRVTGVLLGEADLRAGLGVRSDDGLLFARGRVVTAARAAGLDRPPLSVHPRLRDPDGLRRSTLAGRDLGFFGRSAIHPEQVPIINEVFTPDADEAAAARATLAEWREVSEAGGAGFVTADGRFVDPAVVAELRATVAAADAKGGPP